MNKIIFIFVLLFFTKSSFADAIYLKNGNKVKGIVTQETDTSVELKINFGSKVVFSKEDITNIERDSQDEHIKLEEAWSAEKNKLEAREISKNIFEQELLEKGFVKYQDKWVRPEEKERMQVASFTWYKDRGQGERRFSLKKDNLARSDIAKKLLSNNSWLFRESEHFIVFYNELSQAKIVSDKAEYYFEKIAYDLGRENDLKWNKKCQIFIVESADKWKIFLKEIGLDPDLVGGFVPNYQGKEMFLCALSDNYLAYTFPHELTHLIFKDVSSKNDIPLWLNEGLANYEANLTSISDELLAKSVKNGTHILLSDLLRTATYPIDKDTRELFYAQSEKLVEFLITQYGREKFKNFCSFIFKDKSFNKAMLSAYAKDFRDIDDLNMKLVQYIIK
jgi:hypothetical protein